MTVEPPSYVRGLWRGHLTRHMLFSRFSGISDTLFADYRQPYMIGLFFSCQDYSGLLDRVVLLDIGRWHLGLSGVLS